MHRFHLPPDQCLRPILVLGEREAHHASCVLRVQSGERVTVLDGAGGEFQCEVAGVDKRAVQLQVLAKIVHPSPHCEFTLLQAIPKGKILESIIEKATELGVHRIVPLLTERVTTRLEGRSAVEKADKWRLVAIEAIKQCGAPWLPTVEAPMTLRGYLARGESFDLALLGALQVEARHPRETLREFERMHGTLPRQVAVWIGPEGDFTLAESQAIQSAGAKPITLGKLVLRVETAAIYCLSFLNYELQE